MCQGDYKAQDEMTIAEIIWALKVIESDYSGKSIDDKTGVYKKMFQDTVVKTFPSGKLSLLIFLTIVFGPYFWKMTLDKVGRKQLLKRLFFLYPDEVSKPVSAHSYKMLPGSYPLQLKKTC